MLAAHTTIRRVKKESFSARPTPLGRCFRHCRGIIEPLIQDGTFELMVTANILRNTFEQPNVNCSRRKRLDRMAATAIIRYFMSFQEARGAPIASRNNAMSSGQVKSPLFLARPEAHTCVNSCPIPFIQQVPVTNGLSTMVRSLPAQRLLTGHWPLAPPEAPLLAFCPHLSVHS